MPELGYTVAQLVEQQLPTGFVVSADYVTARQKWWETILPLLPGMTDPHDESQWTDEWNMLIAYLIIWDIFQKALSGQLLTVLGAGANGTSGGKLIKTIKTGPTEVQYQDTAAAFAALMKILSTGESPFAPIFAQACILAHTLKIKIPFCPGNAQAFMFSKMVQNCKPCQKLVGPNGMYGPPSTGGVWNSGEDYIP